MNKFIYHNLIIFSLLLIQGCTQILEPISLNGKLKKITSESQEEFEVSIKTLNFQSAQLANKYPYPRKLMRKGSGSKANVFNETEFNNPKLPDTSDGKTYLIGTGDVLSFNQHIEYATYEVEWPKNSPQGKYLIGVGDELIFAQQGQELTNDYQLILRPSNNNSSKGSTQSIMSNLGSGSLDGRNSPGSKSIVSTRGIVDSDGNVLLLGLGKIKAADRSLTDVQTEVRNVLIRNGLAPNFQLEISSFASKKAFVTTSRFENTIIPINSIPTTLKELALAAGVLEASKNTAVITLNRGLKVYRYTAAQLFKLTSPKVYIEDGDQIEIVFILDSAEDSPKQILATVGSRGNILLPRIGSIKVINRSLKDVQLEVSNKIKSQGLKPSFQLELVESSSESVYFLEQDKNSKVIPLPEKNITLRELVLNSANSATYNDGLTLYTLHRGENEYILTGEQILSQSTKDIWLQDKDRIEIERLNYKPGQVFAITGSRNAQIISIKPSQRETLADVLFVEGGALQNVFAQRSEVYLLRGKKPLIAYHLDAQNVSRLLVAAKTELRPDDIIFVADRPIISFARTLAEINPLRILIRDLQDNNFP